MWAHSQCCWHFTGFRTLTWLPKWITIKMNKSWSFFSVLSRLPFPQNCSVQMARPLSNDASTITGSSVTDRLFTVVHVWAGWLTDWLAGMGSAEWQTTGSIIELSTFWKLCTCALYPGDGDINSAHVGESGVGCVFYVEARFLTQLLFTLLRIHTTVLPEYKTQRLCHVQ